MHSPEAHVAPSGLRDFLRAYAMIVLSILTAMAFERAAVSWHDNAAARRSKIRIERELDGNAADLRVSIAHNKADAEIVNKILAPLLAAITQSKADPAVTAAIIGDTMVTHIGISTVSWQRDAWDAAVADQSASHLDPADLQRYASIYAQARDSIESFKLVINAQLVGQIPEVQLAGMLNKLDAHECALLLMRYLATVEQIDAIEGQLAARLSERAEKGKEGSVLF